MTEVLLLKSYLSPLNFVKNFTIIILLYFLTYLKSNNIIKCHIYEVDSIQPVAPCWPPLFENFPVEFSKMLKPVKRENNTVHKHLSRKKTKVKYVNYMIGVSLRVFESFEIGSA